MDLDESALWRRAQTITTETDQLVITAQTAGLAAGTYSGVVIG
ncbi:MAG: hypothetical protein QM757_35410 [Paludibaculum sp.]